MTKLIIILLSVSTLLTSDIKKRELSYSIVIGGADLIVEGFIKKIQKNQGVWDDSYELEITDALKTNTSRKTINVEMFKEWTCDFRKRPFAMNQKLLLFLKEGGNGSYQIINGSTGELIIEKDTIVNPIRIFSYRSQNYQIFKEAVQMFADSYEYKGPLYKYGNEKTPFKVIKSENEIKKMQGKNTLFEVLTRDLIRYYNNTNN
ncbi:hypothetical protein GCM10022393_32690 [Aquimarina addita]|uniref:DUF4468 domain-containing protein n=1 Tax=Aquimarina addita TaxID=870485 RepID=A0ABP6UPN8_9FLAO